jgi:oxygen-independent coproporphyrinogen III oxidase
VVSDAFGIYVHVPWCRRKCPYCAFNVFVAGEPPFQAWADLVQRDWHRMAPLFPGEAHSLYFGGGTPSLAPSGLLGRIAEMLPMEQEAEITVEANPEDVTPKRLAEYLSHGVTRISLGIQTFSPVHARFLNRGSSVSSAEKVLEMVSTAGFSSWSFDLIFGLPGQSLEDLRGDLEGIGRHLPPHVSLYGLTYEEGTPLDQARLRGRVQPLEDREWALQFEEICSALLSFGYVRYELSNFALEGHRSRHNEGIWRNRPYVGLGPGAHGFLPDGRRSIQPMEFAEWENCSGPRMERPSPQQTAIDALLTWIRHADGFGRSALERLGFKVDEETLSRLAASGHVVTDGETVRLGGFGWALADSVTLQLVDGLVPADSET